MPIRADLRKHYDRRWRDEIRPRILARGGGRCEQCQKPSSGRVLTMTGKLFVGNHLEPIMFWRGLADADEWRNDLGEVENAIEHLRNQMELSGRGALIELKPAREIRAQVGVAHLNHVAGDDRPENLRALCNWCHLNFDKVHHREARSIRKDKARPLLFANAHGG